MSDKHKVENTTVVDPTIIKLTRDTLGQFVKRPPLTEKLLNKPPFRFLHDIMTAVISSTGFMKGLFMDAELDSENVKDKEAKIAFLQKAIDMVSLVTGHSVLAKPNKIVAGQEPEKTNEFLQALAEAVNKKVENSDYVSRVLAAEVERKKLSSKTNKPTSPRKASTVKEPKTEAGAARQEDKTGKSEIKGDKPKPQRQEDKTVKAETKSDMPALQRQEDRTGKSEMKSDKPKPQRQEDKTVKAEMKSDMPALQRQEDRTGKSEMKSDKPKPQRQEDKAVESDTKRDKPRSQRLEDNTVKYELKGDKPKPQRQEANTVKSETKSDKPKPQRQEDHTAKSESKSHKPRGQRLEDHAVKSETKSHKPRSQRLEDHTVKSETKSDKPKPQRLEDSTIKSESKSDKPRPPSHSRDVKGSHSEVKTDKKDVRSEKSVTETDKSETARTESSESKSDKLESRKDKRRVMKTDKQDTKIERQVTKSDSEAHSGKLISPRQITRGAKIESKKEKLESRVVKPIPEHAEVDEPKTDRQKPVLASLDVKDAENSKLVGDAKKNIRGHPNSKTGATLWDLRTGEPGRELLTTENSPNQESKLFANQEPIKVSPRTQSLDSKRQREADQVTGEKQETKTEMPAAAVQNVNSAVSKKETAGKDLLATGGKASTFASKKETGGKASNLGVGEKQEAKRISPATGRITRYSLNEQPKPKLTQDDGSTDSGQSECVNVRQEKPSDKQRLPKALRNDELKKDAVSNAFTTNKSSSSLTSRLELLTPSHQESPSRDEQDVRNDLPISARHDSFEVIRDVKLQDVRPAAGPGVNSRRPNDGGSLLLNPAEKNDLRLHEHQSAEEFWDSRRERKARRDKTKGEKRTDVKSEKRKVSVSKQDVRPDKLGPRGDRHEIHTIKESRSEKATLKPTQNSPPKSGGEKTDELQLVSQKLTTAFDAETQRFEDEHQKPQIYEPDVDVILDRRDLKGEEDEDDDEAEFLVREDPASVYLPRSSLDLSDESNEHGGLVKKILKTKKGLEALVLSHKATIEIDRSEISGGDISQKRQRALLLKDVGKLRSTIQALTGNVIPLVKIMDFLQEDLDCMKKEMEQWKDEIEANTLALQHEQRLLEASIEPLQLQLSELEKQIEEQEEINAGLKSQALQNEEKIRKIINTAALLSK